MSKGKKRLGFDYTITLEYATIEGEKGTIRFEEVTDDSEGKFAVLFAFRSQSATHANKNV